MTDRVEDLGNAFPSVGDLVGLAGGAVEVAEEVDRSLDCKMYLSRMDEATDGSPASRSSALSAGAIGDRKTGVGLAYSLQTS